MKRKEKNKKDNSKKKKNYSPQELGKLTNPSIADENIQPPKHIDSPAHKLGPRLGQSDIPRHSDKSLFSILERFATIIIIILSASFRSSRFRSHLLKHGLEIGCGAFVGVMVYGNQGTLTQVFERDGSAYACRGAGYGCHFSLEKGG